MKLKIQSMMKRLVVLMFCLCLISPSVGMTVSAEEKLPGGGTHTYIINDEEQSYQSLKEAVSQAEPGATIKLTEDESIVKTDNTPQDYGEQIVVKGKSITIDLAGHTIKNNNTHPNYTGHAAIRVDAGGTEYSFILRERAGDEADIVYDDSTYEVVIILIPEPEETVLIGTQSITIHRFDCDIKFKDDDGNELQNGTAPVFTNTVEYTPPETPPEEPNDKPNEKPDKPVEVSGDSPQTGDTTGIFIWIGLLTASLTGCITIILFSRKKRYNTKRIR